MLVGNGMAVRNLYADPAYFICEVNVGLIGSYFDK